MGSFVYSSDILKKTVDISHDSKYIISSDMHIGNEKENFDYIKMMVQFALNHEIFNNIICGDLFEGLLPNLGAKYKTYDSQIEHFMNDYPESKDITNYYIYGNHDKDFMAHGINIDKRLSERKDFINIGQTYVYVLLHNIMFILKHESNRNISQKDAPITFRGHSHSYVNKTKHRTVYVPTLSDVSPNGYCVEPGFLVLEMKDNNAYISNYVIEDKPYFDQTVKYKVKTLVKKY